MLYDAVGKILLTAALNQSGQKIRLPEVTNGIYLYRIEFENANQYIGKLNIIQNE